MDNNLALWLWLIGVSCIQLLPWTIRGIDGIFQKIPDSDKNINNKISFSKYLCDLFLNQISILFIVPLGLLIFGKTEIFGLIPKLTIYYYFIAFIVGIFIIWIAIKQSKIIMRIMQKYLPKQLEHDLKQYSYNMKKMIELKLWQRLLLGLFNGFSEELLMRVFLVGSLVHFFNVPPVIALLISVFLNGLQHTHQGRIFGFINISILQSIYAISYLLFNDFLFIGIMHCATDLAGLYIITKTQTKNK